MTGQCPCRWASHLVTLGISDKVLTLCPNSLTKTTKINNSIQNTESFHT